MSYIDVFVMGKLQSDMKPISHLLNRGWGWILWWSVWGVWEREEGWGEGGVGSNAHVGQT